MNTETLLAVFGVIATIIFGYFGIRYTLKYRKRTEIIFLKNNSISLFKTVVKNLEDVEIKFQGKKIDENLILFKGTFFNNGNFDIDKSIVHKPLEIELPENYTWIRHKLVEKSDDLILSSKINNHKLIFEWDLLKEGEYFTFESLVEYKSKPEDKNPELDVTRGLTKNMKINHRITNLKNIDKRNTIPRPLSLSGTIFFSIIILLLVGVTGYFSFGQFLFPRYKVLNEVTIDSTTYYVEIEAKNKEHLSLVNEKGKKIKEIKTVDLNKVLSNNTKVIKKKLDYAELILFGFLSAVYFIFWISMVISEFQEKRLYKKIKSVAENHSDIDIDERKQIGLKLFELRLK